MVLLLIKYLWLCEGCFLIRHPVFFVFILFVIYAFDILIRDLLDLLNLSDYLLGLFEGFNDLLISFISFLAS